MIIKKYFFSGYWHRLQLHAQDCFKKILKTRLMLYNTSVNTVITRNNGYFEGRYFISKDILSNLTKVYSQKITNLLLFAAIYSNQKFLLLHLRFFIFSYKNPAGNYLLRIDNRNTRKRCEICSKLTIKTTE